LPKSIKENLLVRAALEAILAKSVHRLDATARAERLKAAALMECAEKGYVNLTIADVARRAKISTATIYADYADRDALLASAMEMLFLIVAGDVIELPDEADPVRRVERLLIAHGMVYAEPLAKWFFRLHVTLAWAGHGHLRDMGRRVFDGIDAFWMAFLLRLVEEGHLAALELDLVVPILLGPVERCTIIAALACGDDSADRPRLEDVARHSAQALFKVYGRGGDGVRLRTDMQAAPALAQTGATPSLQARLDQAMADVKGGQSPEQRKQRILLAAAVECRERGYNAASMIEVAARAGVSTAALYKHYNSKQSLFVRVLEQQMRDRRAFDHLRVAPAMSERTVAEAIFSLAQMESDPEWSWIPTTTMASELSGAAEIVTLAREQRQAVEAFWSGVLADLVSAGQLEPCDPALTLNLLSGAVERSGVLALILFGEEAVDLAKLAALAQASAAFLFQLHGPGRPRLLAS
jgi:AcrR family transcriptional regulator